MPVPYIYMKYAVEVNNLVKRYNKADKNAVDGISFKVEEGKFFAFLGPNGAGKTTTISILNTTLSKTSGEVNVAGYDLDKNQSKIREKIGVIFQKPSLDENLTAEENVRLHVNIYGLYPFRPFYSMMPDSYKTRVNELADIVGIRSELNKPIKSFSGGMKRKLEIIRSLMHQPHILFLAEPTSGLDPEARKSLWEYLSDVSEKHRTTMFLTTHYLDEAEGADEVCIINKGKIISFGTPEKIKESLLERYVLVQANDMHRLDQEISEKKLKHEDGEVIKLFFEGESAHQLLKSIDTPLTRIQVYNPTLEEAYLNIIESQQTSL